MEAQTIFSKADQDISKLNDEDIIDWIQLSGSRHIGPKNFYKLVKDYGSAHQALRALPNLLKNKKIYDSQVILKREEALREYEFLTKLGGRFLTIQDTGYPERLKNIDSPPPILRTLGDIDLLTRDNFSVVGSRNASLNAKILTKKLVKELSEIGLCLASGLARGIDTVVHEASLENGTIAFLGCGVDRPYPEQNKRLYEEIKEKGLLVSEFRCQTPPSPHHFPQRNRLITGISVGVLVIEAHIKSGSITSAQWALEQGREVFAVPGFPLDPRAGGTNLLLKQGAHFVEAAQDIIDVLKQSCFFQKTLEQEKTDKKALDHNDLQSDLFGSQQSSLTEKIYNFITFQPTAIDEIARECHVSIQEINKILIELELLNKVIRQPGNMVVRNA